MEHELALRSNEQERIKAPASSSSMQEKPVVRGMGHPVLGLQRKVGNRVVQRMVNSGISSVSPAIHTVLNGGGAQPLDPATRTFMEPRFGHDFTSVRVHTDERAAESARAVNALAYTVGQDVVFDTGQYAPHSSTGQSLLAHELAHVVQQGRGGASPSPFVANTLNEGAAREAASMVTSGGVAKVGGASGVGIACMPRSLEVRLNPATLSFTELEDEINEIQQRLDENPVSNTENDQLMEVQSALRKELAKRQKQEKGGSKRRPKVSTFQAPRSLTESLRVDETLPDVELYHEINAIHVTLESGVNKKDQAILNAALVPLEAEKQRRERARKIQRAFAPKVTSTDGEALIEVMGFIESIRPSETISGQYTFVRDGKMLMLTQEEYDKIRGAAQKILMDRLGRVRQRANDAQNQYDAQKEINEDQYIVSGVVHFFGGIDDPGSDIAQDVRRTILNANAAQVLLEHGQFKRGAEFFTTSELFATIAKKTSQAYVDDLISTAGATVTVLEITRDAAFATTLALGAAVAAPVVAAGAAGFGLTGASAVVVTAVGTGGVVGVEGALLRGGSAAGGVALAGGSLKDVVSAGESEGWRGFKEGAATGVGGGVAHSAGAVLKVGQSASKVVNIVRGSVAQGLGNAAGSATSTGLEGGSVIDVLKSASKGGVVGTLTGPLSQGAGAIKNPVLGAIARTTVGGVVSGGQTYLETGNREAAFRAAAIGGASSLAIGPGESNEGPTPAQEKAFEFGRAARSQVNSAARTVRSITAATMLGLANAVPAIRGTGAAVGDIVGMPIPGLVATASDTAGSPIFTIDKLDQTVMQQTEDIVPRHEIMVSNTSADVGLSDRGYRPQTGERTMTKAQYKALSSGVRWAKSVDEFVKGFDDNVSSSKVTGGKSDPRIDGKRVPDEVPSLKLDGKDIPLAPGETQQQAIVRVKTVIGRKLSDFSVLEQLWNSARTSVLAKETLTASNYADLYDRTRVAFWRRVRSSSDAVKLMNDAGFDLPKGRTTAPLLRGVNALIPIEETRISLDHIEEKALNWLKALDADNLRMEFARPNSEREIKQMRHPELRE